MSTIDVGIKVDADSRAAVQGLRPLETSLKDIEEISRDAEDALQELGDRHKVSIDDDPIKDARDEIDRLRREMRDQLRLDVNADTRDAQRRIRGLRSTIKELERDDVDVKLDVDDSELDRVERRAKGLGGLGGLGGLAGLGGPITALAAIATVATGGLGFLGFQALKLSDQMDNAKISFTQFLGTSKKADKFLANLKDFAAATPFEFSELVESSGQLLAFGIAGEDVIDIMTTLGDAAALTGTNVSDLTGIWGQMQAKGKVANEELLQLTERGIPAYQILADAMNKPVSEIQKMAEKGELLSGTTLPVLQAGLDNAFGGGMAKKAETLSGKMSTLKDTLAGFGTSVGDALAPAVSALTEDLQPALEGVAQWAKENQGAIAIALTQGVATFLDIGAGILDFFAQLISVQATVQRVVGDVLLAIGAGMQSISGLPGIPDDFGDSVINTAISLKQSADGIDIAAEGIHGFADSMRAGADNVRQAGADMAAAVKDDEIKAKIDRVKQHIAELKKRPPTPKVTANIKDAEERLARLKKKRDDVLKGQHAITVQAKIDKAKKKLDDIKAALRNLRKQKPTPEVRADIKHWKKRLGEVKGDLKNLRTEKAEAKVEPKVDANENAQTKNTLEDTASPGGKGRNAPIKPNVDDPSLAAARTTLDLLVGRRDAYVYVHTVSVGGTGGEGGGPGRPRTLGFAPPAPDATGALVAGSRALTATPRAAASTTVSPYAPAPPGQAERTGTHTQLRPRQTPVAVYLDGVEIAHRIEARRAMAATESVRRMA